MQIRSITATPGVSSFFFDDQRAIQAGAESNGFTYQGTPVTPGYERIREPGEALLVELELGDGRTVRGDCAAVQYSGVGDRDPLFRAHEYVDAVEGPIAEALVGRDAAAFKDAIEALSAVRTDGKQLHTAVRYGVSQALLAAAATVRRTTQTRVLADTLDTTPATEPVPVFGQSGAKRRRTAEKMLLKTVAVLPHGLFNSVETIGREGDRLRAYLAWLSERADELGTPDYEPRFHVDVYGTIGELFGPPYDRTAVIDYFRSLAEAAAPYPLQVEGPVDANGRAAQISAMGELRDGLAAAGVPVDIVADEWCDSLSDVRAFVDAKAVDIVQIKTPDLGELTRSGEAVACCEGTDIRAYLGGTCNETTTSARACAHLALATDAAQILAKPGMGFDEGYTVVTNEMRRALARHGHDPK